MAGVREARRVGIVLACALGGALLTPAAGSAKVAFVDSRTASVVDGTQLTLPRPTVAPGDILVAAIHVADDRASGQVEAPFIPGNGWAPAWNCPRITPVSHPPYACPYGNGELIVYAKVATASEPMSYTFQFKRITTPQPGLHSGWIGSYRYAYTPSLAWGSGRSGTTTQSTACPSQNARPPEALLCVAAVRGAAHTPVPPAGMTMRGAVTPTRGNPVVGRSLFVAERTGTPAAMPTFTWSSQPSDASTNSTGIAVRVLPDHPKLTVTGPLRDQAGNTTFPGSYSVTVSATDAIPGAAGPGIERLELWVDNHLVDVVEQTCGGACDLSGTFWVNTADMEAGEHWMEVRAIDGEGTTGYDRWAPVIDPTRTIFTLAPAAPVDDVVGAVGAGGRRWVELGHDAPGPGGFVLGNQSPAEGVAEYKEAFGSEHGTSAVPVSEVTVGGIADASALGSLAGRVVETEYQYEPSSGDDPVDETLYDDGPAYEPELMAADAAAEEQGFDSRAADPDAFRLMAEPAAFAPTFGSINTFTSSGKRPKRIVHSLTFPMEAVGDVDGDGDKDESPFERSGTFDHGYEHDLKLIDIDYDDGGVHPFCFDEKERFWAIRKGRFWTSTFPSNSRPYFDTHVSDPCRYMDFTIGVKYPLDLQPNKTYFIRIHARAGDERFSRYQLLAQKTDRYCGGNPASCSDTAQTERLAGPREAVRTEEFRRWRKGRSSVRVTDWLD